MKKLHRKRKEILEEDIKKTLLKLALPLMFINMIQVLYNLADTFWLGRLGKEAVSAPTVSWPVIATMISFGAGFVIAGLSLVSQYFGAGKFKKVSKIIGNLYSGMFIFALIVSFLGFVFSGDILRLMKAPVDVYENAKIYMRIIFLGIPFAFAGFVFSFSMRAMGDMMMPVKVNLITIVLNAILDPLLIFGIGIFPKLGVVGAAIATIFSNTLASLIGLYIFFSGRHGIKLSLSDFEIDSNLMKKIFSIGIHSGMGNSLNNIGMIIMISIVNLFGSVAVAAYGIVIRIVNLFFSISMGVGQAMATMVGQNIGAERYDRVKKIVEFALVANFIILLLSSILMFIGRYAVLRVFINDENVIATGTKIIEYYIFSLPFFALFGITRNSLRVAGQTKKSLLLGLFRLWVLRIPLAYYLSNLFSSVSGVWIAMGLSNVIAGLLSILYLLRWTWIKRLVK